MRKQRRGTRSWRGQRQESSPGLPVSRARLRPRQPHLSPGLTIWASGGASPGQGPAGSTGTAEGETQRRAPAERGGPRSSPPQLTDAGAGRSHLLPSGVPTSCAQVASGPPGPVSLLPGTSAESSAPHTHTRVIRTHVCAHMRRLMRKQKVAPCPREAGSPQGLVLPTPAPRPYGLCPSVTCLWPPLSEDPRTEVIQPALDFSVLSACCPAEP